MYVLFVLVLCLSGVYAQTHSDAPHSESPDRQWQDVVNQQIANLERLMTVKDEIINQLESKIQNQDVDMQQLKQDVTSLQQLLFRKNTVLNNLAKQVTDLDKRVFTDQNPDVDIPPLALNTSRDPTQFPGDSYSSADRDDHPIAGPSNPDTRSLGVGGNHNVPLEHGTSRDVPISKQNRVSSTPSTVAFHASLTTSVALGTQAPVVFNHETLDQGNGYNPSDGIYSVPESGTYVITWTMLCDLHKAFQTQLMVNGVVRGSSFTDADEINDYHQTSQVIVLALNQGDHMFIHVGNVFRGGNAGIRSANVLSHPTFSGWKI